MAWALRHRYGYSTGWVPVSIPTGPGYLFDGTGSIQVRRRRSLDPSTDEVDIRLTGVGLLASATAGSYLTPTYFLPVGYRTWFEERSYATLGNASGSGEYRVGVMQASRLRLAPTSAVPGTGNLAMQGTVTVLADGARPTGGA